MNNKNEWLLPRQIKNVSEASSKSCKHAVVNELENIDILISEVERKESSTIYQDDVTRKLAFKELRRHGFGKTVVIKSEKLGEISYRVSLVNCDYASTRMGYSTPNSSYGKLCRSAKIGYDGHNERLGDFEIIEIRNSLRFRGLEAEDNIRNFKFMRQEKYQNNIDEKKEVLTVQNLSKSLKKWFDKRVEVVSEAENSSPIIPESINHFGGLEIEIDDFETTIELEDEPEIDIADIIHNDLEQDDLIGLSNYFYLNPTETQLEIMDSSVHTGPMLIEGIAGSGKTCVAIGRAKTLCDSASGGERLEGDNSGRFFAQESSAGFVKTGELIQYLKASCNELGLSHFPIKEYKELQHDLNKRLNVEQRPKVNKDEEGNLLYPKYELDKVNYDYHSETTMSWLSIVDKSIASLLRDKVSDAPSALALPNNVQWPKSLPEETGHALLADFKEDVIKGLSGILSSLDSPLSISSPFYIDGYAAKIKKFLDDINRAWFTDKGTWVKLAENKWKMFSDNQKALSALQKSGVIFAFLSGRTVASVLMNSHQDLERLIATGCNIFDQSGTLVNTTSSNKIWQDLTENKYYCDVSGPQVELKVGSFDDVIFSAAAGTLLIIKDNKITKAILENPFKAKLQRLNTEDVLTNTSLQALLKNRLKTLLLSNLKYADLYTNVIKSLKDSNSIAKLVANRVSNQKLAEHDVDILLAIAQIISRGASELGQAYSHLEEQENYFRTVFIDEVQDFSEIQVFVMGRQAHPEYDSITMVGDLFQQLYSGSASEPGNCFPYQKSVEKVLLGENKRQENRQQLVAVSSLFRATIQKDKRLFDDLSNIELLREKHKLDGDAILYDLEFSKLDKHILEVIKLQPKGRTVAVICPQHDLACELEARLRSSLACDFRESYVAKNIDLSKKYKVHFSSPEHIKGLEFDTLIFAGAEHVDWTKKDQLNKLYVSISRPRKHLAIFGDFIKIPEQFKALFS
ncbi:UvrD-helicase domain-containing protein [Colwellia piezophila]|uniref:UvrD-helicase domain-containing protein n=1 Tax=Colwellia piezophila TaxID=211668 RepID=UPI00035E12D2|nr:UvrD-helicase domain-containing protein [Colwellia piezophila]